MNNCPTLKHVGQTKFLTPLDCVSEKLKAGITESYMGHSDVGYLT